MKLSRLFVYGLSARNLVSKSMRVEFIRICYHCVEVFDEILGKVVLEFESKDAVCWCLESIEAYNPEY